MRIPNLLHSVDGVPAAVDLLVNNAHYREAGNSWIATTIGLPVLRPFMRTLFLASGSGEIDVPFIPIEQTYPQKRALAVSYLIGKVLGEFLVMRPHQ